MAFVAVFLGSAVTSFYAHHFAEKFFTRNWTRNIRLIFKGYQIHHSTFGAMAIVVAVIIAGSFFAVVLFGYGLGNVWQHKKTHNKFDQKGMVFISKIPSHNI
ncbi:MAG: hypothetical protein COT91_01655 [Candidatus Doudnabacteria bacterium CG10_big_fil_rev_8_21_14_0_10_41_10]|uniref:Uncharacterized protein n=1 Tax=Candidatus Doudnabacteria bacterium CG10_big_fil_rev_8_21_14_0_10_41_10 TaxID=1974551 RepID=A0A2H0VE63_9BACT|nr:MAG: hypothetical protein COT91_01655 [Candidatus Doudnabacteria bacterium CG10_big_fil_rev_8_21_14_0_10_41_10]